MLPKLTDKQYEVLTKIPCLQSQQLTKIAALLKTSINKCENLGEIPKWDKKHKNFQFQFGNFENLNFSKMSEF